MGTSAKESGDGGRQLRASERARERERERAARERDTEREREPPRSSAFRTELGTCFSFFLSERKDAKTKEIQIRNSNEQAIDDDN